MELVELLGNQDSLTPFMGLGATPFFVPWGVGKLNVVLPILTVFAGGVFVILPWGGGRHNVVLPILIVFAGGVFVTLPWGGGGLNVVLPILPVFLLEMFLGKR